MLWCLSADLEAGVAVPAGVALGIGGELEWAANAAPADINAARVSVIRVFMVCTEIRLPIAA